MKKLLMLLFLMTISLGQSQTFPLDFSDAADLIPGVDGVTTSIVQDNGDSVLQIVGSNGSWDNCQVILAQNLDLSDNANNTITFRFKSIGASTSGQHLLKFEGGTGGAAIAEGFFNASGTDWETITIDFGAGLGIYSKLVIFTDSGAASNGWNNSATGTYLIDDIAGGTNVAPPVVVAPTDAATAPSARNAWDVVSIYTDGTYADKAATNFNPGWGQATVYTPFALGGNNMLKYSNLNYQGIAFASGVNVSAMTTVHLDLWTADCSSFQFFLIGGGENSVTLTPTLSGWNSFDIPLTSYSARTLNNIIQFKLVGNGTVYLDNLYFSRPTTTSQPPTLGNFTVPAQFVGTTSFDLTAPTSNSAGAITFTSSNEAVATIDGSTVTIHGAGSSIITANQAAAGDFGAGFTSSELVVAYAPPPVAAPTPTKAVEDVISIFSGAPYTDFVGVSPYSFHGTTGYASVSVEGNPTNRYTNFDYVGNTFGAGGADVSAMEFLHLDIWTPNCTTFRVFVLDGGPENSVTLTPSLNGWNSFDIPLSSYSGLNKSHITEFKYDNGGGSTIYMDNLYFWKAPSGFYTYFTDADSDGYGTGTASLIQSPTAPSGYSVNATDCNDADAAINPGATEIADGIDNNCDGTIDEGFPPSSAAPTPPARNIWDVKSIFSGAYSNVTLNEFPTNWSDLVEPSEVISVAGNSTLKFKGQFLGMVTNYATGVDLSQMTTMHIDYYTTDTNRIDLKLVNTVDGGDVFTALENPTVTGTWRSIDIPLSAYGSLNLSKITQILIDPAGVSTVYVDNFYFYRAATTLPAPVVANITQCKGAPAVDLTAIALPGYGLKWYKKSTDTAALAAAPKNVSSASGTITSYVAQYLIPDGTPGPKAAISVVTTTDVTPAVSSTLLLKNSSGATVTAVGPFIGTATEFTLEAAESTTALASYKWTLPSGVNQVFSNTTATVNDRIITVKFDGSNLGTTGALPISVQSTIATGGCPSAAKTLNLTRAIPAAPSNLKMNNGLNSTPITSFAKYMGTGTVLRLSAALASTARSYVWELPEGVTRVTSLLDSTTVTDLESDSPEIFVTFSGVTNVNTATLVDTNVLRIGVKSKNAVGVSTTSNGTLANPSTASTAKLLTLTAVKPAAPASLKMYDLAVSASAAVTAITTYVNTETELKLEAKESALASSYTWVLSEGVNVTKGSANAVLGSPNTYTSSSNAITVNFWNVPHEGAFSLVLGVKATNGIGESVSTNAAPNALRTDKLLTLTAALPSVPGAVTGSLKICATTASSVTYTIAAVAAKARDYMIEAPQGCTITVVIPNYGPYTSINNYVGMPAVANASFTVNYPAGFIANTTTTITITSLNYVGPSATAKVLTLTNKGAVCGTRIAPEAASATEAFSAVAYPNPSSTEGFRVRSSNGKSFGVQVYDMLGRSIEQRQMSSDAQIGSNYAKGIYNVIVNQGANVKTLRVIKQ